MPIEIVELHEEAAADYDAAFDWYLERSPEAARSFDTEFERALRQIAETPQRWGARFTPHAKIPSETFSLSCDLP